MSEKACRTCKLITTSSTCPACGSTSLSKDWTGLIIILDEKSQLAKKLGIKKPGRYALRVR